MRLLQVLLVPVLMVSVAHVVNAVNWGQCGTSTVDCLGVAVDREQTVSVLKEIEQAVPDGSLVTAWFADTLDTEGWNHLDVRALPTEASADDVLYAAGVAEGYVSAKQITQMYHNFFQLNFPNGTCDSILSYFKGQIKWIERKVEQHKDDGYWGQVGRVLSQLRGLQRGIELRNAHEKEPFGKDFSLFELFMLNADGDLEDLTGIFPCFKHEPVNDTLHLEYTSCSALIKPVFKGGEVVDILFGHATWSKFGSMHRVFKHYDFTTIGGPLVSFSSRAGFLSSKDDYYIVDGRFAVMETTNSIFNQTLYDLYVKPQTVPTWIRSIVANSVAKSGKEWVVTFGKHNSGTYNNQWMVVDRQAIGMNRDLLWISEQIPGYYEIRDVSQLMLSQGYWASYNIPFFVDVYDKSGYNSSSSGDSYSECPRAQLFKREAPHVLDMSSLKKTMR
jgi:hypothetical protein